MTFRNLWTTQSLWVTTDWIFGQFFQSTSSSLVSHYWETFNLPDAHGILGKSWTSEELDCCWPTHFSTGGKHLLRNIHPSTQQRSTTAIWDVSVGHQPARPTRLHSWLPNWCHPQRWEPLVCTTWPQCHRVNTVSNIGFFVCRSWLHTQRSSHEDATKDFQQNNLELLPVGPMSSLYL